MKSDGMWQVIRIPASQLPPPPPHGSFAVALFGKPITPSELIRLLGPMEGTR